MFTKNMFAWLISKGTADRNIGFTVMDANGMKQRFQSNKKSVDICSFGVNLHNLVTAANGSCVMIGTGRSAPTREDYKLESPVTSGITITNGSFSVAEADEERLLLAANYTVRNDGTEELVISEIGAFSQVEAYPVSGSTTTITAAAVLMERTVFDAPVTIPPGESRMIQYAVRITGIV